LKRAALVLASVLVAGTLHLGAQQARANPRDLIGTWTLTLMGQGVDSGKPATFRNRAACSSSTVPDTCSGP